MVFYIHGGAFFAGSYLFHGANKMLDHDVVMVQIQYRVGALGFMCLDHPEASGNMGLLDQVRKKTLIDE